MRLKEPTVTRKAMLRVVKEMPERMDVDDIIDRILILSKIERGLEQAKAGKGFTTAEARKRVKRWSK